MHALQESYLAHKYRTTLSDLLEELLLDPEALELFEEFHPTLWEDLAEQGYRCLDLEQLPQAARIFAFLQTIHPEEPAYHAAYADAKAGLREYLSAGEAYYQTAELAPEIPDAHLYLAEIWIFFRHHEQAQERLDLVENLLEGQSQHPLRRSLQQYQRHNAQTLHSCTHSPQEDTP